MLNCHCRYCRRAHGGPFVTVAMVASNDLHFQGGDAIREVHTPGVGWRAFCTRCGSRLYNRGEAVPRLTSLVVGTLDDDRGILPAMHVNVESKASWYEIRDDLPRYPGLPPGAEPGADPAGERQGDDD